MAGKKTGEKQPTVSVIIGTFNSAPTLPACLSSVFAQKYKNIEAIIVDKGSTDSTLEIARSFPVRIIEGHVERCTQWNAGAKIARGKFIYFLGADMETHQDFISEAVKKCLSSGASAIYTVVSTKSNAYWARVRGFERKFYLLDEKWQAARFIEKGVFWKIGGWNEKLVAGEDWDLQE
ncbi:glycosyltransferase [Candidatus Micrarchaeota archaeon]|nr:glycosyltransferase [Candidatus Micrarchaeota archaeon]